MAIAAVSLLTFASILSLLRLPVELPIVPGQMQPNGGNAYVARLDLRPPWPFIVHSDDLKDPIRSDLKLLENGQLLDPPHTIHAVIREEGKGAFSHWENWLVFSASDNSDPRTNDRNYVAAVTAIVSPQLVWSIAAAGGFLALICAVARFRQCLTLVAVVTLVRRAAARFAARLPLYGLGAAVPAALSLGWMLALPPLWNGTDSSGFLLWQLEFIPHFPPLYPLFMRAAVGLFGVGDATIHAVQMVQHAAVITSIAYLATAYARSWQVLTASIATSLGISLNLFAHGIFTEGLALSLLTVFLGTVLRFHLYGWRWLVAIVCVLSLVGLALTRHAYGFVGVLLPAYWTLQGLTGDRRLWERLRFVPLSLGLLVTSLGAAEILTRSACVLVGSACTPIVGRAGVYRVQETYKLVPESEHSAWIQRIAARVADPDVELALTIMATQPMPWSGPHSEIASHPRLRAQDSDVLMNRAFFVFAFSFDHHVLCQWRQEIWRSIFDLYYRYYRYYDGYFGKPTTGSINSLMLVSARSLEVEFHKEGLHRKVMERTSYLRPGVSEAFRRVASHWMTAVLDRIDLPILLMVSLLLGLLASVAARGSNSGCFLLAVWLTIVAYVVLVTFATVILPRYMAPVQLLLWICNAVAVIAVLASERSAKIRSYMGS